MSPEAARGTGETVLALIRAEAVRYGVDLPDLGWGNGQFEQQRDPASGDDALIARWKCGGRKVELTLRPDGHVYGECDLLVDHPQRPKFWMDTLSVWGLPPAIKFEPNLIAKPD